MKKLLLTTLFLFTGHAYSVDHIPIPESEEAEVVSKLEDVVRTGAQDVFTMKEPGSSFNPDGFRKFTQKLKSGTFSYWELKDKDGNVIDSFYARNGAAVTKNMRPLAVNDEGRPQFATINSKTDGSDALELPLERDTERDFDAEVQALARAFNTRKSLNLGADDVTLTGYIDKPSCSSCQSNLEHFEFTDATTPEEAPTKVASDIEINFIPEERKATALTKAKKQMIVKEVSEAFSCQPG